MTLEEYLNEENLEEAKSLGASKLKEMIKGHRKMDKRSLKFYLGDKPMKHAGTDVDLNAFKPQLEKVNELIGEYNSMIDKIERDAVPDADANKGFAKKVMSLKKQIDKVEKDLTKRRDAVTAKMKDYDKQARSKLMQGAGRDAKAQKVAKKKMDKYGKKMGKLAPFTEERKERIRKILGD